MKLSHHAVATAQVGLFTLALGGFLGLMFVIVIGQAHLDATTEKLIYTMLGVLGTIVTQMSAYFYARQRPDSEPAPPSASSRGGPSGPTSS